MTGGRIPKILAAVGATDVKIDQVENLFWELVYWGFYTGQAERVSSPQPCPCGLANARNQAETLVSDS